MPPSGPARSAAVNQAASRSSKTSSVKHNPAYDVPRPSSVSSGQSSRPASASTNSKPKITKKPSGQNVLGIHAVHKDKIVSSNSFRQEQVNQVASAGSFKVRSNASAEKFTAEVRAATLIGRAWRKRTRGFELDRKNLVERLMLEDAVCVGITRLIIFVVLFIVLYQATLVGVPSGERRATEVVLTQALGLEEFTAVRTLPAYREEMVKFSHAIKEFSASGSERFPDEESVIIVGGAVTYSKSQALTGLDLQVAAEEFTMTAWVEVTDESHHEQPILRKPLSTNPALSCWGWYFPDTLHFGAHDYHSVNMDMESSWQHSVSSGAEFPYSWFNHEAIVVHNHTVTFYRNGQELNAGGTVLPRTITDCEGSIEIGYGGLKLSSVKFYPRALNKAEIQEINVNGQPLSEIATGSILRQYQADVHDAIIVEVDTVAAHTDELLEDKDEKRVLDDMVADSELSESEAVVEAALFPTDPSPPATLPPSEPASFLPTHERHAWEHDRLRNLSDVVVDRWKCDDLVLPGAAAGAHRRASASTTTGDSHGTNAEYTPSITYDATTVCPGGSHRRASESPYPGQFWSIVEDPVYSKASRDAEEDITDLNTDSDPLVTMNLTHVPTDAHALTFTFWVKAINPTDRFSLFFRVGGYEERDVIGFHVLSYGAAVLRVTDPDGHSWPQLLEDMFAANQVEGPLDEKFFVTAVNHDAIPTVWRHVAVVFHLEEGYHESFLDGRLIKSHHWHSVAHIPISSLVGKNITVGQAPWYGNVNKIVGKIAQFRMYPRALSQVEIQNIQDNSQWPDHTPIKQCHEVSEDTFKDSDGVDHHGRSCSWYHEMMTQTGSNLICTSAAAKALCPLTCRGERECSSGYPFDGHVYDEYHDWLRAHSHTHYRIFDRIMHLKPQSQNSTESEASTAAHRRASTSSSSSSSSSNTNSSEDVPTLICPGSSLDLALLVAQCNDPNTGNATYHSLPHFYETWEESVEDAWAEYQRADLSQCDALTERIDAHQCGWDDSWVPHFMEDVHAMEQFAVNWWARPADTARLKVAALNFFSSLVPPRTLFDVREQNPFQEAITRLAVPTSQGQLWSGVNHRGTIDFVGGWTYYYVKFQKISSGTYAGQWQVCLAVNGFPLDCHHSPHLTDFEEHPGQPFPETFLRAFEITTEMFISPIEWSTDVLSVPEVQEQYYRMAPKMARLLGPRNTELARLALLETPAAKETHSFSERLLLAAPPFLYQERTIEEPCSSEAMSVFLSKQLDLIQGTHCNSGGHGDVCPSFHAADDVYACKSSAKQTDGEHYGQTATALNLTDPPTYVFADFLYSIADNDVLVRGANHDILTAVEFVDRATETAVILCLFHSPESGDTTVLDVAMSADGSQVSVSTVFSHFGYLERADREQAVVYWSIFFALCAVTLIWNVVLLWLLYFEAHDFPDVGWDSKGVFECAYDLLQVVILIGYGAAKLVAQLASEDEAQQLVGQFVEVPFRDSTETVQNKVDAFFDAVTTMRVLLESESTLQTIGFFTMILMLIRIINATAVHPRTGVLIGTIWHGLNDIWHFAILFMLVFVFSSMVSSWSFGTRPEFEDLQTSMQTQFDMLLGSLPNGYAEDPLLIIYVALTNIVQFFLMLNFLLAIVVESYMKVREHIEEMQTENEIVYDVGLTVYYGVAGSLSGWPNRRRIATLLQNRCARKNLSWVELYVLGVPKAVADSMIASYGVMEVLHGQTPQREMDMDRVGGLAEDAANRAEDAVRKVEALEATTALNFLSVNAKLEALMDKLGVDVPPPVARIEMSGLAPSVGVSRTISGFSSGDPAIAPAKIEAIENLRSNTGPANGTHSGETAEKVPSVRADSTLGGDKDKADETEELLDAMGQSGNDDELLDDSTADNLPGALNLTEIEDKDKSS